MEHSVMVVAPCSMMMSDVSCSVIDAGSQSEISWSSSRSANGGGKGYTRASFRDGLRSSVDPRWTGCDVCGRRWARLWWGCCEQLKWGVERMASHGTVCFFFPFLTWGRPRGPGGPRITLTRFRRRVWEPWTVQRLH